jgi:uncharacterized protein
MSSSTAQIDRGEPRRAERGDPAVFAALADPETYGGSEPVAIHETHASWVFVVGRRAYKVKKPLVLAFLDYSTLARRRAACREEVRVNRDLAPGIYLGVRAIVRTDTGFELAAEHAAGAIEYAVEMLRFSERDTLAGLIACHALGPRHVRAVARRVAAFHRGAPVVDGGRPAEVLEMWQTNLRELAAAGRARGWQVELADGFGEAFVRAHAPEIERRRRAGLIRDGHGDLRCEHVLALPPVRIVDRVEFDPRLRRTDVACDLAFLAMDLEALGQGWAAAELLSAYRREGIDPGSRALRSFYAAHRAIVRAKVELISADECEGDARVEHLTRAEALWALGERLCWRARAPLAVVVCGPAASGKSTLAGELSRRSGIAVLSSDAVRKAAAGLAATERAGPEIYGEANTRTTYELLGREGRRRLRRQGGVIVDATCRARGDRDPLLSALRGSGAVLVVRCEVPLEVALQRASRRMHEGRRVSDATPEIVAEQHDAFEALQELPAESVLMLDTEPPLDVQVAEVTRAVDHLSR